MSAQTHIAWCDSTHNEWYGCTAISPGCAHCYAEARMDHRLHRVNWGEGQPRIRTTQKNRSAPLRWDREAFVKCPLCGWRGEHREFFQLDPSGMLHTMCPTCASIDWTDARRRVFTSSLGDVFDNEVPVEWLADLLETIRVTTRMDWLVLTKRVGNVLPRLRAVVQHYQTDPKRSALVAWIKSWMTEQPPANVWLGITVVNQAEAQRDIRKLLAIPAVIRFLSLEPLLEAVDLVGLLGAGAAGIHWVIVGGESGPGARPMWAEWAWSILEQCSRDGVAVFFKQAGAVLAREWGCAERFGRNLDEWPASFRIQQFPVPGPALSIAA